MNCDVCDKPATSVVLDLKERQPDGRQCWGYDGNAKYFCDEHARKPVVTRLDGGKEEIPASLRA